MFLRLLGCWLLVTPHHQVPPPGNCPQLPLPDLCPVPRGTPRMTGPCKRTKVWPLFQSGTSLKGIPAPELPVGLAKPLLEQHHSQLLLCPVLPPHCFISIAPQITPQSPPPPPPSPISAQRLTFTFFFKSQGRGWKIRLISEEPRCGHSRPTSPSQPMRTCSFFPGD